MGVEPTKKRSTAELPAHKVFMNIDKCHIQCSNCSTTSDKIHTKSLFHRNMDSENFLSSPHAGGNALVRVSLPFDVQSDQSEFWWIEWPWLYTIS